MKKILWVAPNADRELSVSARVSGEIVRKRVESSLGATLVVRDLAVEPIPHFRASPESSELATKLCREIIEADEIVIAAPMWNFSIPSVLKAWIDHIVMAGVTFRYAERGPVGILPEGKRLYIVEASGGDYLNAEAAVLNHVSPYLRQIFGFLGIHDVVSIPVPGTAYRRELAISESLKKVESL
jgi:FMN-dependent NADH-azoreductase